MKPAIFHSRLMRVVLGTLLAVAPSGGLAEEVTAELPVRFERAVQAMGTTLRLNLEAADRGAALAASERALRALEETESRLSTWRSDSELSRINRASGDQPMALSQPLAEDLALARWCSEQTEGAFDPTIGALIAAWGLRTGGRQPSDTELATALAATGMNQVQLDGRTLQRRREDVRLEEGGFGKGVGLAEALAVLAADELISSATLDFGGQMAILGASDTGSGWAIELADPRERSRSILEIQPILAAQQAAPSPRTGVARDSTSEGGPRSKGGPLSGSFATSGNSERGLVVEGRRIGHLLDPRTGWPAPDFGSLTVWAADPAVADCLSTGLYVLGPDRALGWALGAPGIEALAVVEFAGSLTVRATPGFAGRIRALVSDLEIEILTQSAQTKPRAGELPQHKALPLRPQTNSAGTSPRHS